MESALQHGTAAFFAGIQTTSAASHPAERKGAWRYGKRSAFPTSPHPDGDYELMSKKALH